MPAVADRDHPVQMAAALAAHLGRPVTLSDVGLLGLEVLVASAEMGVGTLQMSGGAGVVLLAAMDGADPIVRGVYTRASSVLDHVAEWITTTRDELTEDATGQELRDALYASATVLVDVLVDLELSDIIDPAEGP